MSRKNIKCTTLVSVCLKDKGRIYNTDDVLPSMYKRSHDIKTVLDEFYNDIYGAGFNSPLVNFY